MKRPHASRWIVVGFILIACLGIALRLYKIDAPLADWHSFRQTDTASVARQFTKTGIDILRPTYQDLSNIQSGKDNPKGYRMVEFPLYQAIGVVLFWLCSSRIPLEVILRLITIFCSTATGVILGVLVAKKTTWVLGVMSSFVYAILPYSVFYGRVILPEPMMVFWCLAGLLFFDIAYDRRSIPLFILSAICAAVSVLVKPYSIFAFLTLFSYMRISKPKFLLVLLLIAWGTAVILPYAAWRAWIAQFPEGIPASDWLLNEGGIRLRGAWFYWLFAERIGKLILGYWGLIPLGIGVALAPVKKEKSYFFWFAFGLLLYMIVFAGGNVKHDYYQIFLLPIISFYVGKGLVFLFGFDQTENSAPFHPWILRGTAIVSMVFALSFSWYTIRTYYWINRPEIVEAGRVADAILAKDAKVIAPYNGDTTFLYQTNRTGWPLGFDIDKKISMGATHYVTVSPTDADLETRDLARDYTVVVRNDKFAIIDLTKKK
jgi:hypothetical protein